MNIWLTLVSTLIGSVPCLLALSSTQPPPLVCYVGNCTTFQECRAESLLSHCPREYEACLTTIDQKAHGRLTIVKKCGLAPCSDSSTEFNWWRDECDRKSDEDSYTCTTCCGHTQCNAAATAAVSLLPLLISLFSKL